MILAALAKAAPAAAPAAAGWGDRPIVMVVLLAALSLLPFALVLGTSFVKIAVVLSLVRNAIGAPQVPPTMVVTGLAMLLSAFVMAPVGERVYAAAKGVFPGADATPAAAAQGVLDAVDRGKEPVREFLAKHAHAHETAVFHDLARRLRPPADRDAVAPRDLAVLAPAFATSELKEAFEIGFLLFLPFLIVDLLCANVLGALGLQTLSPTTVSLPFKLLLFVLVDGWTLLLRGLVLSYA